MNKEEKQLADAYDSGELNLHPPSDELLKLLREAGENTFKKDKRINIRLSSHDLLGIQRKAARKGVPYQALIAGLIHQYVEGDFQEATRWAEITKSLGHTNLDLCGIECDGATYHSHPIARDRDRIRQEILENRGWDIFRIWSTDWYRNRRLEVERLLGYLRQRSGGNVTKINN